MGFGGILFFSAIMVLILLVNPFPQSVDGAMIDDDSLAADDEFTNSTAAPTTTVAPNPTTSTASSTATTTTPPPPPTTTTMTKATTTHPPKSSTSKKTSTMSLQPAKAYWFPPLMAAVFGLIAVAVSIVVAYRVAVRDRILKDIKEMELYEEDELEFGAMELEGQGGGEMERRGGPM